MPGLTPGEFTVKAYLAYAAALRARAAALGLHPDGHAWTPQDVGLALWAYAGGKGAEPPRHAGTARGSRSRLWPEMSRDTDVGCNKIDHAC